MSVYSYVTSFDDTRDFGFSFEYKHVLVWILFRKMYFRTPHCLASYTISLYHIKLLVSVIKSSLYWNNKCGLLFSKNKITCLVLQKLFTYEINVISDGDFDNHGGGL